jgi:hypothetical protein
LLVNVVPEGYYFFLQETWASLSSDMRETGCGHP